MRLVQATQLFKGFSDPTRLRMLNLLRTRPLTGTQIADILALPQGRVARHLAYLYKSRLVSADHHANEAYYSLHEADDSLQASLIRTIVPLLGAVDRMRQDVARAKKRRTSA